MKIRFAVTPPLAALDERVFADYLATVEGLGFDTLWLSDVPLGPLGDPLVSLSYAAACTTRLKLGANLVPLGRHPLWLAKQLAQLDRLSGGRVLLSFVPGLGAPAEKAALGLDGTDRGRTMEVMIDLLRRWWAGEAVSAAFGDNRFEDLAVTPRPLQQPLEIWLGGKAPAALSRVARLADGWLTSAVTPAEAGAGRRAIERAAAAAGRRVDAEHFGISLPYCRDAADADALAALRARRADGSLEDIVVTGTEALRTLVAAHVDAGLSKFVVRPLNALAPGQPWRGDLEWLAETVLPLQS